MVVDTLYLEPSLKYLENRISKMEISSFIPLPSNWAKENRYLPPGISAYHGKFEKTTAPHMIEILDRLHPEDPCQKVTLMKSVQSTGTVSVAENAIGHYIRYKLGSILFLTSSKGIARIRSSSAIDVMIDHSNLSHLVKPFSERMKRKTSDTTYYKEFVGGVKLLMSSYNSIGDLKSNTFHFIVCDEWDEAPPEIKDQGDISGIIEGRTMGLRNFKILEISTPSRMETSRIYSSFQEGDQRYYFVPCPYCGEMQILVIKGQDKEYGLTFTTEKDPETGKKLLIPETVRYICQFCKKDFGESKKQDMLIHGEWRPTARPVDPKRHSYHVNGLYSPEMFLSWERICQQFINTNFGQDLLKFKDFVINYKAEPWISIHKSLPWEELFKKAENYCYGQVPPGSVSMIEGIEVYRGPLILTAGVDIQKDRIEMHVLGFGVGLETWSIDYQVFYGDTDTIDSSSWTGLEEFIYTKTYKILGKENFISKVCIDAGYDPRQEKREKDFPGKSNLVYDFVANHLDRCVAIMGVDENKILGLIKESRVQGNLKKRYDISTGTIKEMILNSLSIEKDGPGKIHFPKFQLVNGNKREIPPDHFKQFLSERYQEIRPKKFGWKKIYKRNEVFDTFIYARVAAEMQNLSTWTIEMWSIYYHDLLDVGN